MANSKMNFRNPNVRNPLIIVFIAALIGYLWYEQFLKPTLADLDSLVTKKEAKETELRTINALKPQLTRLRDEMVVASAKLDSLKDIFPDQKEVPRLIRRMTSVTKKSDIVATRFHPLPDVQKEYYVENKYNVAVAGDYHNLGEFFSYLANFQLIINLSSVTISANPSYSQERDKDPNEPFLPSIIATFEMTTFSSRR
ncbi:MAG: type 4a pilus biogenesis protein PilO [Chitinispirillaceae bacterium]